MMPIMVASPSVPNVAIHASTRAPCAWSRNHATTSVPDAVAFGGDPIAIVPARYSTATAAEAATRTREAVMARGPLCGGPAAQRVQVDRVLRGLDRDRLVVVRQADVAGGGRLVDVVRGLVADGIGRASRLLLPGLERPERQGVTGRGHPQLPGLGP